MREFARHAAGRLAGWACVAAAAIAIAPECRAQFNGDPFDPFRASYRSSSMPTANQFAPGMARQVTPPGMGTVPGIGMPWNATFTTPTYPPPALSRFDRFEDDIFSPSNDVYRRYDEEFGRVYRPNAEVDQQFVEGQERRQELYLQAMRETDPQRRAELIREYRAESRRISLGMSPSTARGRSAAGRGGQGPAGAGASAAGPEGRRGLPASVRSYEDLVRWSRVVNREAVAAGVVAPAGN